MVKKNMPLWFPRCVFRKCAVCQKKCPFHRWPFHPQSLEVGLMTPWVRITYSNHPKKVTSRIARYHHKNIYNYNIHIISYQIQKVSQPHQLSTKVPEKSLSPPQLPFSQFFCQTEGLQKLLLLVKGLQGRGWASPWRFSATPKVGGGGVFKEISTQLPKKILEKYKNCQSVFFSERLGDFQLFEEISFQQGNWFLKIGGSKKRESQKRWKLLGEISSFAVLCSLYIYCDPIFVCSGNILMKRLHYFWNFWICFWGFAFLYTPLKTNMSPENQ